MVFILVCFVNIYIHNIIFINVCVINSRLTIMKGTTINMCDLIYIIYRISLLWFCPVLSVVIETRYILCCVQMREL